MQVCPYCLAEIEADVFFTENRKEASRTCHEAICVNQYCMAYGEVVESIKRTDSASGGRKLDG